VGDPVVFGSGLSTDGTLDGDALDVGDASGVAEALGVADGLPDGDRDGVRDGLGPVRVGLGDQVGVELGWTLGWPVLADSDTGIGRTRMYSAKMARNRPEMISVEVRGRPVTRHPRWPGQCQGRRRR
jgi:hypothetical protein